MHDHTVSYIKPSPVMRALHVVLSLLLIVAVSACGGDEPAEAVPEMETRSDAQDESGVSPEQMAAGAAAIGAAAAVAGLYASLYLDTPSGPSIVVAAAAAFALSLAPLPLRAGRRS